MALAGITADWLFANSNKTEAEALLASLENADGTFLVRKHKDPTKCKPISIELTSFCIWVPPLGTRL